MKAGIKPTVDVVFKRIFGSPESSHLTLSFLNDLLSLVGRPKAASLEILNPWRLGEFRDDKEIAVDVRAKDEQGRDFQVEMQVRSDPAPRERMLDNWARLYAGQLGRGKSYARHRPAISIWILGHSLFAGSEWLHPIEVIDRGTSLPFGDGFLILALELEKRAALSDFDLDAIFRKG